MSGNMPLIGVTPWFDNDKHTAFIKKGYCEGIIKAGGATVLLPYTANDEVLSEAAKRCDGFLISGGPDIDPCLYGELNLVYNGTIAPCRDMLEIFIVRTAIENNKPILGICRGVQIMNVALGGTLYQDINSQLKDRVPLQHSQEAPVWHPTHEIYIEKDSRVWSWFGKDSARVNSFHHQAVKHIAPGFAATSKAPDGIIESIEHTAHRFAVGVQWHPELMWQENPVFLNMFKDFAAECRRG